MRLSSLSFLAVTSGLVFVLTACSGSSGSERDGGPDGSPATVAEAGTSVDGDAGAPDSGDASQPGDSGDASPTPVGSGEDSGDPSSEDAGDDGQVDAEAGPVGVIPATCVDLSGQYQENDDVLTLARPTCGSLSWARAASGDGTPAYAHTYLTDGLSRAVTDESGNPITEEAHVDDVAMYVHRTTSAGVSTNQVDAWTTQPCDLIDPQGVYLQRLTFDASGAQTSCEFWNYDSTCSYGTAECDTNREDGCETNTLSDPNNCGGCGVVCGTENTSQAVCSAGRCVITCAAGFADCDQWAADGCETNIASDVDNCGACNSYCRSAGATSATCSNQTCDIVCDATHANCNGSAADGCEIDTSMSGANCGGCGLDCGGALCVSSSCDGKGETLVSGVTQGDALAVDASYVYYDDGSLTLYAYDKLNGGTPLVVASNVDEWAAAGDGSVYWLSFVIGPGATVLSRWTASTKATTAVATLAGSNVGVVADTTGVVWTDETTTGNEPPYTASVLAWEPGDSAPHALLTESGLYRWLALRAIGPNDVLIDDGSITRVPRGGGAPQTLLTETDEDTYYDALILGSTAYIVLTGGIDSVPLAGGTPQSWFNGFVQTLVTDGTSLFAQYPATNTLSVSDYEIFQMPAVASPTPTAVAYVAADQSGHYAVDASYIYFYDGDTQQIRRVAR